MLPLIKSFAQQTISPLCVLLVCGCLVALAGDGAAPPADTAAAADFWTVTGLGAFLQQQPLLLLMLIIAAGMGLGSIRVGGLTLGVSGVLFAALLAGHLGRTSDWTLPSGLGTFGLTLFVYAVGLGAGPTFFRTFFTHGKRLAVLAAAACGSAAVAAAACGWLLGLPGDLAAGIFAGSMTSTPGLASAVESCEVLGANPQRASIGYGLAYPIGVVATVLFVQLGPRLLGVDLDKLSHELQRTQKKDSQIGRHLIEIANPAVFGKGIHDIKPLESSQAQITRVLQGNQMVPIPSNHVFERGQVVMLVADDASAETLTLLLGKRSEAEIVIDSDRDRLDVVVTSPELVGHTLRELHLRGRYGVTISRIERYGVSFVPHAETALAMADHVIAVGPPEGLAEFLRVAGHRERKLHETDLASLAIGLSIGVLLGLLPISLPGMGTVNLGLAGGPLLAGLLLGHFGRFFGVVGYMPLAARNLIQNLGLALFLADAGFLAGSQLTETLDDFGPLPFALALVVAVVPLATTYVVATYGFRMNLLETLGGTCGAMTSTAGVGAITGKTDSDIPVTSYAAAYPVALVLMTICARLVVTVMT